jgi:hypothetical protein
VVAGAAVALDADHLRFHALTGNRVGQAFAGVFQQYALRIALRLPFARGWPAAGGTK